MLAAGDRVERYVVEGVCGRGGFATVYRVRHVALGTLHALKLPHAADAALHRRLLAEARVQARLNHPNVLAVQDTPRVGERTALLLPFVDGPTLAAVLDRQDLLAEEAIRLLRGLASALVYAHGMGVVHQDVKPANVLLGPDGTAQLGDFGLARLVDGPAPGPLGGGTPAYHAPEQIDGLPADARVDVFGFGLVAYEVLSGNRPFRADNAALRRSQIREGAVPLGLLRPDLPPLLTAAVMDCLADGPADRPATLDGVLALLGGPTPPSPPVTPSPAPGAEPGARAGLAVAALVVTGALFARQPSPALEILAAARDAAPVDPAASLALQRAAQASGAPPAADAVVADGVAHGAAVWVLPFPGGPVYAEAGPDGEMLAVLDGEARLSLVGVGDGRTRWAVPTHVAAATDLAWSPDGREIAVWSGVDVWGDGGSPARTFRVADGQLRHSFAHAPATMEVHWTSDAHTVVTQGGDGLLRAWDAGTGAERWSRGVPGLRSLRSTRQIAVSDDRVRHMEGCDLVALDVVTGDERERLEVPCGVVSLLQGDGRVCGIGETDILWCTDKDGVELPLSSPLATRPFQVAVGPAPDGPFQLWSMGPLRRGPTPIQVGQYTHMRWTADGELAVPPSIDGVVRAWRIEDGAPMPWAVGHRGATLAISTFERAGTTWVASASADSTVRLWSALGTSPYAARRFPGGAQSRLLGVDGDDVLVAGHDGWVRRWASDDSVTGVLAGDAARPRRLPDGGILWLGKEQLHVTELGGATRWRRAYAFGTDATLRTAANVVTVLGSESWVLLDSRDGSSLIGPVTGRPREVDPSPRGAWAVEIPAADDQPTSTISVWDVRRRVRASMVPMDVGLLYESEFSPDDAWLALSFDAPSVAIVSLSEGREMRRLPVEATVRRMQWAPDGRRLVVATQDGTLSMWDAVAGTRLTTSALEAVAAISWDDQGLFLTTRRGNVLELDPEDFSVTRTFFGQMATTRGLLVTPTWVVVEGAEPRSVARWSRRPAPASGALNNLRACPTPPWRAVPVVPFPESSTVWAPEASCR